MPFLLIVDGKQKCPLRSRHWFPTVLSMQHLHVSQWETTCLQTVVSWIRLTAVRQISKELLMIAV